MATNLSQEFPAFRLIPASKNLIAVAAELNAATKALSLAIEDIEAGLQKLNLGISAWVPLSSTEDDSSSQSLGYTKNGARWGLVVRQYQYDPAGEVTSYKDTFLCDAPREIRIWAAGQMQALFVELTKEAESLTAKIKKNLDKADIAAEVLSNADVPKQRKVQKL